MPPLTLSGDQAHSSAALVHPEWLGNQEGKPSHPQLQRGCVALDLRWSNPNKPMVQRSTALCVGHKLAKELLS
jgi:hypothetical protein